MIVSSAICFSQDIPQSQVPSLIVNNFRQAFPKVSDEEWEIKGEQYSVEFETGFFTDHEAWFDQTGKMVKHKQDISRSDLPKVVQAKISKDFSGYRIDDIIKIKMNEVVTYTVELNNLTHEWQVVFNGQGKVLTQLAD